MKKNFFLGMIAASAMVLATSCSSDELDAVEESNEARVTFNVSADGATFTRAISDGTGANKLVYRVFDKDGNAITALKKTEEPNLSDLTKGHNIVLTLAKGQTYKVAFWAQNSACTAYTVDDNMNVTVDYTNAVNNDETRDAFFKTVEITVKGDATETVELTRPFAQLNVANTDADKKAAETSGIVIDKSSVTIKNAATSLDVKTGKVSGETNVTYTTAAIPSEKLAVDMDGDGTKEEYNYLSMCYVLPNDATTGAAKTVAEVAFTFTPETGEAIELKDGLQNIPLQRNYRTNIVGNILSAKATFNVKIDADYEGEENISRIVAVTNSAELAKAVTEANTVVKLAASTTAYTLPTSVAEGVTFSGAGTDNTTIAANTSVNYGGKDVTFENLTYSNSSGNYVGLQHSNAVSYKNCVITGKPTMYATTVTFDNCTFKQSTYEYCIWTYGSQNITFNNCKFETKGKAVKIYNESTNLVQVATFNDCTFNATDVEAGNGKAAIEIDARPNTNGKYTVNINNCTENGMVAGEISKNTMWNVEENTGVNVTTIYVDGTQVYPSI